MKPKFWMFTLIKACGKVRRSTSVEREINR
jgi:hypothetical protein